ncbi:hypothetical protein EXN66_Car019887 [Channa argus]|uniref:Uncharacterized protein n=1 Tax=Channa argus TaxID=215402 RepID=A0A6G1QPP6_CHAAH|nr:hypothetical protein EXN66_Car019887 [Channa argus]
MSKFLGNTLKPQHPNSPAPAAQRRCQAGCIRCKNSAKPTRVQTIRCGENSNNGTDRKHFLGLRRLNHVNWTSFKDYKSHLATSKNRFDRFELTKAEQVRFWFIVQNVSWRDRSIIISTSESLSCKKNSQNRLCVGAPDNVYLAKNHCFTFLSCQGVNIST